MKKIASLCVMLLAVLMLVAPASAQQPLEFDSVSVSVWPEFDNADALVIYKLALSQKVALPATIELKVPSSVSRLWTVAVGGSFDTVSDSGVDYKFQTGSSYSTVSLTAKDRYIQIEYYDTLKKNATTREYTYQWNGDGAVGTFQFELRQPLKATDFSSEPALSAATIDEQGFSVSTATQVNVQASQRLVYKINYNRATDDPSTSFLQVAQNNQPASSGSGLPATFTDFLPWILGGLGVVFLIVAAYLYTTSGTRSINHGDTRRRHASKQDAGTEPKDEPQHCQDCGKRSQPGDKFCRVCGSKLRK